MSATVSTPRGTLELSTPLLGRSNLANVLAAATVAIEFDVPLEVIADRARELQPAGRRGQILNLARGVTVIDDSYNANPTAVRQALDVLAAAPGRAASTPDRRTGFGRRVAVLGEMLELGVDTLALHEATGRYAAARVDLLVSIGGDAAGALARAAVAAGMSSDAVRYFATSEVASEAVRSVVQPGDIVLVKGSRGVRTDVVVDRLKAGHG
jgi:UDP-N-acetylmuramoyl-tripeptide--D-alanyl-D-alanine ligase